MTVLERLPFWIFFVLGALLIGGASIQYMSANGTLTNSDPFNAVPDVAPGELVFFDQFDEDLHVGENGDVHLLGQIDPFWSTELDFGSEGRATVYAFLPATQRKGADEVPAVVIARDTAAFETWMARNGSGNASIGDLFSLHGHVTYHRSFVAPVVNWLSAKGYRTPEQFLVILPYTGVAAEPVPPSRLARLLPVTVLLIGGFCLMLGYRRLEVQRIHNAKEQGHGVAIVEAFNT